MDAVQFTDLIMIVNTTASVMSVYWVDDNCELDGVRSESVMYPGIQADRRHRKVPPTNLFNKKCHPPLFSPQ